MRVRLTDSELRALRNLADAMACDGNLSDCLRLLIIDASLGDAEGNAAWRALA